MNLFSNNTILKQSLDDEYVSFKELIDILGDNNQILNEIKESLKIKEFENDIIKIKGAKTICEIQHKINDNYEKSDHNVSIENVSTTYDDGKLIFNLNYNNKDSDIEESLTAEAKYSSMTDFFGFFCNMDKYANKLLKNNFTDLLDYNLNELKKTDLGKQKNIYKLLLDKSNNNLYVRAITSTDHYTNYDNSITIFITLYILYLNSKKDNISYSINRMEYSESYVRLYIEEVGNRELSGIGYVKNVVVASNDEIKREALKINQISIIEFTDSNDTKQEIIIQPGKDDNRIKNTILSISHGLSTSQFLKRIENFNIEQSIYDKLFDLISNISKITNVDVLNMKLLDIIKKSRDQNFNKYKNKIERLLFSNTIDNIIKLLMMFRKIDDLIDEDIDAKDYFRSVIYKVLINDSKK